MAWIESHQSLGQHPKLLRLAAELGIHKAQAIGHLHLLWWWALEYSITGDLSKFTDNEVSSAAQWSGDPDFFVKILLKTGWLGQNKKIHDWQEYAGACIGSRRRQKKYRKTTLALRNGNVKVTTTLPNLTRPNLTKTIPPVVPLSEFSKDQLEVLQFIQRTAPVNQVDAPHRFVQRLAQLYSPGFILEGLKEVVAYSASHERWETDRKNWNQTITNWLRRNAEQRSSADGIKKITSDFATPLPRKENSQARKVEELAKLKVWTEKS